MPNNDKSPQKQPTQGINRKTSTGMQAIPLNPVREQLTDDTLLETTMGQNFRDTRWSEDDDQLIDEDPDSNPLRRPSSAIRLNKPAVRRSTRDVSLETQQRPNAPYVPPRRTQKQDPIPAPAQLPARPPVRKTTTTAYPPDLPAPKYGYGHNFHWLLYIGLGMMAALALWALGAAALSWGTTQYNNIVYGYPRTYQIDAVVGHNNDNTHNPSHFIAVNLHGQIIIFELPGGDPSKSTDYIGPNLIGPGDDQLPVTLSFTDVKHDGKPDMIVHISDRTFELCNNGTKFVACSPTSTP